MDETSGRQEGEAKKENWELEVVEDPLERLRLIDATIEERIMQDVSTAAGHAELAGSDHPKFAKYTKENANIAKEAAFSAGRKLQAIQRVIRMDPKQPLPVDRTTYANMPEKAFIVLDKVPDIETKLG